MKKGLRSVAGFREVHKGLSGILKILVEKSEFDS